MSTLTRTLTLFPSVSLSQTLVYYPAQTRPSRLRRPDDYKLNVKRRPREKNWKSVRGRLSRPFKSEENGKRPAMELHVVIRTIHRLAKRFVKFETLVGESPRPCAGCVVGKASLCCLQRRTQVFNRGDARGKEYPRWVSASPTANVSSLCGIRLKVRSRLRADGKFISCVQVARDVSFERE